MQAGGGAGGTDSDRRHHKSEEEEEEEERQHHHRIFQSTGSRMHLQEKNPLDHPKTLLSIG